MSSHIVSDVESACDSLIVLASGHLAYHATMAEATDAHRLADGPPTGRPGEVAGFARPGGAVATLIRSSDPSLRAPTLEELVMGYLSTGRSLPPER